MDSPIFYGVAVKAIKVMSTMSNCVFRPVKVYPLRDQTIKHGLTHVNYSKSQIFFNDAIIFIFMYTDIPVTHINY